MRDKAEVERALFLMEEMFRSAPNALAMELIPPEWLRTALNETNMLLWMLGRPESTFPQTLERLETGHAAMLAERAAKKKASSN